MQPTDPTARERKGLLFAVADGMGGQNAGEVASTTAISTLMDEYYSPSNSSRIEPALQRAVQAANLRVHDLGQKHLEYRHMGTTLTAMALAGATAYIAHVGDSRAYRLRNGQLKQLTQDHSEVADLVRLRIVKPDMAGQHPSRNVLTRTIGHQLMLRPDFLREPAMPGDVFVMCTDGVWSELTEEELAEVARQHAPEDACRRIIDLCLQRECGDNVSVQIVQVHEVDHSAAGDAQRPGILGTIFRPLKRM